jgi:hypothetical protein
MSYEAWIWWQFLANRQSPRFVADLQLQMAEAGDKGQGAISAHAEDFQRFVVEYVAGKIADASGANLPAGSQFRQPFAAVTKNDKGKTLEFEVQPFVAGRFIIQYDPELRVFESDATSTDGEVAMVEWEKTSNLDEWKQVAPEVRSKCKGKKYYALAVTTGVGTHTAKVKIDRIEEASCDPCMLGTWDLDLDTFAAMILDAGAQGGQALPPGTDIKFSGNYYTSLDDQGAMKEQRDGLVITTSSPQGSIDFTIDSYAEGRYTADGEQLEVFEVFEFFADVSTSVPGLGGMEFPQGSSFSDGGSGAYECRTDGQIPRSGTDKMRGGLTTLHGQPSPSIASGHPPCQRSRVVPDRTHTSSPRVRGCRTESTGMRRRGQRRRFPESVTGGFSPHCTAAWLHAA